MVFIPSALVLLFIHAHLFVRIRVIDLPNDYAEMLVHTLVFQLATTPFILAWVIVGRHERRAVEALRDPGRIWCASCGYELTRLSEVGSCPECNEPYDHTTVPEGLTGVESASS